MLENNLANWFYILGISYFVVSFLLLIGLAITGWILYRKAQELQTKILATVLMKKRAALSALSLTKLAPLAITAIINQFIKKRK